MKYFMIPVLFKWKVIDCIHRHCPVSSKMNKKKFLSNRKVYDSLRDKYRSKRMGIILLARDGGNRLHPDDKK